MTKPAQELWDVDINMFTALTRLCPPAKAPESCHMDPGRLNTAHHFFACQEDTQCPLGHVTHARLQGVGLHFFEKIPRQRAGENVCSGWWTRSGVTSCEGLV